MIDFQVRESTGPIRNILGMFCPSHRKTLCFKHIKNSEVSANFTNAARNRMLALLALLLRASLGRNMSKLRSTHTTDIIQGVRKTHALLLMLTGALRVQTRLLLSSGLV